MITAITLIAYLPAALEVIVDNADQHFRSRAASAPLVIGARGSSLELVLGSLYFDQPLDAIIRYSQFTRVEKQEFGQTIPLLTKYRARDCVIVGTTTDYAKLRNFDPAQGRLWNILGECVVGAHVAKRLELKIGSKLPVTSGSAFVLDGAPLRLNVVGILEMTETADDEAIFVDLKTTWVVAGLGHGHSSGAAHGSPEAGVYTDITPENAGNFHFHGNDDSFPLTAIIVVPQNRKAQTLLLGQYLDSDETVQIVRPADVMDSLLKKVLMIRSYIVALVAVVSFVTLLTIALVIILSIQLRRNEIRTMSKIGCSQFAIATILGYQIAILLAVSAVLAATLTFLTDTYGRELIRLLIL